MNPKKPHKEKAIGAGISLPRDLIERAKKHADMKGFASLSALIKWLLTQHLAGNQHPTLPSLSEGSPVLKAAALKTDVESVAKSQGLTSAEWVNAVVEKAIKSGVVVRQQVSYEIVEAKDGLQRKPLSKRRSK
jgi:hypothetical protein